MRQRILVLGAGGFIGNHPVTKLVNEGHWVRGVDIKLPEYADSIANEFILLDLTKQDACNDAFSILDVKLQMQLAFDEVYQLAADMGGAGYVFSGENDAAVMWNSAQINLNVIACAKKYNSGKIFYSSSACIYPERNQLDPNNPNCREDTAYPADPDSEYGWEKLFSERMYINAARNWGMNVRIARFHNIFGPYGTWEGGKEKAPAAMCRKVAEANDGSSIEIWGDGEQTRSFLFIDECLEGVERLMNSDFEGPVNIGSEEMVTINELANMTIDLGRKNLRLKHISGPLGVRGRSSDNTLIAQKLGWSPLLPMVDQISPLWVGMEITYNWINNEVQDRRREVLAQQSERV